MPHDRPSHRDPLPLAAGQGARLAVEEVLSPSVWAASLTRRSISSFGTFLTFRPKAMFW